MSKLDQRDKNNWKKTWKIFFWSITAVGVATAHHTTIHVSENKHEKSDKSEKLQEDIVRSSLQDL